MLHLFSSDKIFITETTTFEFGLRNYEEKHGYEYFVWVLPKAY